MSNSASYDPEMDARDLDLGLLRVGLFALIGGTVLELVDLRVGGGALSARGVDVLPDVLAALSFFVAARAIAQPAARAQGVTAWALWAWAGASLLLALQGLALDLFDAELLPGWPRFALELVQAAGFVAVCVSMRVLCAARGLASSERWRRVAVELVLLYALPLIAWRVLGGGDGEAGGFSRWVMGGWMVLRALALFDLCLAAMATARSAARRI